MSDGSKEAPAIGISLQVTLDQRRTLVLQSHVPQSEKETLNAVLDSLTKAADRQDAKYTIEAVRRLLRQAERNALDTISGMERSKTAAYEAWKESGRDGEPELKGSVATDISNSLKSLERFKEEIEAHHQELARLEALAE